MTRHLKIPDDLSLEGSKIHILRSSNSKAFNTNGIVFDNSPWRPGRDMPMEHREILEDERKIKNVATRIMSNGVEVLVKDKSTDGKQDPRKFKFIHITSMKPPKFHTSTSLPPNKSLLTSAVSTVTNLQTPSMYPIQQLMQHNYIIKTCMTTYTYLTTVVQNKRSAISTFETIVSVITTESLTNMYASDLLGDLKPTKLKFMEIKTIQPSAPSTMYVSAYTKIDKRFDNHQGDIHNFDLIQPSEVGQPPCSTSCSCSDTKTESLKTKYTSSAPETYNTKASNHDFKVEVRPTQKESDKNSQYNMYGSEHNVHSAPTDKIVEKYTEVINDYSDEKDSNSIKESDLLTNEQAPTPSNTDKISNKEPEKNKPDKSPKPNKNNFIVADLLKLGSLSIKGLSQLAPVIEKMTDTFMKRQDINKTATTTTTTTNKPAKKITPYIANKRVDNDMEFKHNNFPIYIPVDEMETSESQIAFTNATLHQNFAWAAEFKQPKANKAPPKIRHESPLVNGGIPISPGEIITANSDVIVGKPAVGGPFTLGSSGMKLQNPVNPPPIDNYMSNNEPYLVAAKLPLGEGAMMPTKADDSFDLRPPEQPKIKPKPNREQNRLPNSNIKNMYSNNKNIQSSLFNQQKISDQKKDSAIGSHGMSAFLDYIPSYSKPTSKSPFEHHVDFRPFNNGNIKEEVLDNNPSSSEIISTSVTTDGEYAVSISPDSVNKPFLVDIQPSRVANVIIPHGSSTALVFAGSSEPHKTGEYIDDPLPYPEPGYFGSFSIDAPQMTNVHNVVPNNNQFLIKPGNPSSVSLKQYPSTQQDHHYRSDGKVKWKDNKRPIGLNNLPPPVSTQESHLYVGPQVVYNPDAYRGSNQKANLNRENDKPKSGKEIFDKEYENYLAVPPPPPPKMHVNHDNRFENNKPYNQRPVIHTQPIQDMKVFLNVQHPVPKTTNNDRMPPKVTSEVYFAAQAPNTKSTSTYTIQLPPTKPTYGRPQGKLPNNYAQTSKNNHTFIAQTSGLPLGTVSAPNLDNKSQLHDNRNDKVKFNAAPNVRDRDKTIQSLSFTTSSPISTPTSLPQLNTDIPIGSNIVIRVEDDPSRFESSPIHSNKQPKVTYNNHGHVHSEVLLQNNQWNKSQVDKELTYGRPINNDDIVEGHFKKDVFPSLPPSLNSHANFPMINDHIITKHDFSSKNTNNVDNKQRPAISKPNTPTNSHGWYSGSYFNENNLKNINNIHIEVTTRKVIPLSNDYNSDNIPDFGHKIASIGKPPVWQDSQDFTSYLSIGKPFSKSPEYINSSLSTPTTKVPPTRRPNLPSNIGPHQPAYDIPIRDNSHETTTIKTNNKLQTNKIKPVYENSEEIYDGEDEFENNESEADGEVSLESMKVPVITSSSEADISHNFGPLQHKGHGFVPQKSEDTNTKEDFNAGTQTEKPFGSFNNSQGYKSNEIKQIDYDRNPSMKPRPFTMNTVIPLDHQLQQPHWQINQLMENSSNASNEEKLDLNIGEEIGTSQKPTLETDNKNYNKNRETEKDSKITTELNRTKVVNETPNIITSTVYIKDKKPLIVEVTEKSSLPTFTINSEFNKSQTDDIINLSPPPPAFDFNFKLTTKDEIIMGMSPPPPRTPSLIRPTLRPPLTSRPILPARTPPPYRTLPPRTLPPRTAQPNKRPINKEEISTYRPTYDIVNKLIRPNINRDQPSSQLLPPPIDLPSKIVQISEMEMQPPPVSASSLSPDVVFPTPVSTSWLTSTGIDFSSKFNFAPTSIHFPRPTKPSKVVEISEVISSENPNQSVSYESELSIENVDKFGSNNNANQGSHSQETDIDMSYESSASSEEFENHENHTSSFGLNKKPTEKVKVVSPINRNRTRKPYPVRTDDKKVNTSKTRLPSRPSINITPSRILNRPEILYPPRVTPNRNVVRPMSSRPVVPLATPILESSESSLADDFIKPTEVLEQTQLPSLLQPGMNTLIENTNTPTASLPSDTKILSSQSIHHAGNEIKISDDIIPTKTEFKTTVVTLTKTLSEPPKTVSSIGYVNLTHTLTVTHTKTSLVSQSEGAVTQTLVVTNTQTSTIVDVVTKIQTEVQPTTIVETVTKHIPILQVQPTTVKEVNEVTKTKLALDDISMSSEESDNFIIKDAETTENIQKIDHDGENDNDTFFVVMNKSQNGGKSPPINTEIETGDYDITRNEQVNSNGVSQVLFGEILLAGTPYLETSNVHPSGFGKECQPDCKASRNERCQRIDGMMKCICRPGFARMFPDRPCKPTYTYSVKLALKSQGHDRLVFHESLSDNSSKQYHKLAVATHEGINRMIMQSDLRDVYHGVHISGFYPVDITPAKGEKYQGVINDFYVQLSDNAHESRLKEVIEKYLRNNNYSLGGTDVFAAGELMDKLNVSDFDECVSAQFHDCSEHARCFNLRGTYTCSCLEGYGDLSVNPLYPGRICSAEPVGCERCNYHGACYSRDDQRVLCECFQWHAGASCQINLKVVLISLVVCGALLTAVLGLCAVLACRRSPARPAHTPQRSIVACIQSMPSLHQGAVPSKKRADKRALIPERTESGDASSIQNASLPYMPSKRASSSKKFVAMCDPPAHAPPPPPPAPAVVIPRARLHPHHSDSRDNLARKRSLELSSEAKLISYLESGATNTNDEMRRKHSLESSYSAQKDRHNKQGALISAGFKVSTTIRPDETMDRDKKDDRDDMSSVNKTDIDGELSRFSTLRKSYSQEDLSEWTDAERRIGELTLSEARSVGGTLPASTGRAASSTRLTHQEAHTMAERDLGSTFLLPHVHLYKPDLGSRLVNSSSTRNRFVSQSPRHTLVAASSSKEWDKDVMGFVSKMSAAASNGK
ncbi:63 kDa sperm flagellar membrane protein [Papilio machaon]|uniref:63 kDa sperm flagellar membrane protein n=1 Tax=Papilio machaon TaxID=76193 RepID=A0A0N1PHW1_PAPMA|nr:63 kDa sperm flagellar membrane protein [Papilio machaon]